MNCDPKLSPGTVMNNQELCDVFKCSPQGGMRRSKKTNTLVIISNYVQSIYDDRWIGDEFHYTENAHVTSKVASHARNILRKISVFLRMLLET
jgi:hypothetical protein